MKGNIKKTVAGILAGLMMFSSAGFVNAANFDDVAEADREIVDKVVASGAMIGTDKGFESQKDLTRAESVAIMVRLKGISESTVKASAGATNYKDVPESHWASGYINVATSLGLVQGVGDGNFAPDKKISYAETATMLVRAIGGGPIAELDGTWPTNYMNFAMDEKITDGVYKATMAVVNRIETAQMVVNAITSPMWVKSGGTTDGNIEYSQDADKTLLSVALNLKEIEDKQLTKINMSDKTLEIGGKEYNFKEGLAIRVEEGMQVDAWLDKQDNVVWVGKAEDSEQTIVEFTSIDKSKIAVDNTNNDTINVMVNGKSKQYDLIDTADTKTEVSINGVTKTLAQLKTAIDTETERENSAGKIVLENNKVKKILLEQYDEVLVVEKVVDERIYNDSDITSHSNINLENKDYIIKDSNGKVLTINDIKAGDTILFGEESGVYRMMVVNNEKTGTITEKSVSGSYIRIDGSKYSINEMVNPDIDDLKDEVKVRLDNKGQIIHCELLDSEVDSNIGIITEAAGIVNTRGDVSAEVTITLLDGTELDMKELDIKEMEKATKFNNEDLFANDTVANINKQLYVGGEASDLLGQMVRFKQNNNKIEIVEFEPKFKAYDGTDFTALASYSTDGKQKLANITGYKIDKDNNRLTKAGSPSYRIDDNTVVILENDDDSKQYITGIDVVDFDALKNNTNVNITLAKIDENTNVIKYMYIREDQNIARETSDNYGVITNVAETNEDGVYSLEILSNQGEKELTVKNGTNYDNSYVGKLVSYTEHDGRIQGIEVRDTILANLTKAKINKFNDSSIKLSKATPGTTMEILDSMEDLVFISTSDVSLSGDGTRYELKDMRLGDESDITLLGSNENFNTSDADTTTIYFAQIDSDADGSFNDEIGVIIYVRE